MPGSWVWATRVSARVGATFGLLGIGFGVYQVVRGDWLGGMWMGLIGLFLRSAAIQALQQLALRRALQGEPVRRFMTTAPVSVSAQTTVSQLVHDFVYRHHHKMFPVADDDRLIGCVDIAQVKQVPHGQWDRQTVGELVSNCDPTNSISPEAGAIEALAIMQRTRRSRLLVVEDGKLVGVLSLKDLMEMLALKMEMEPKE